MGIFKELNYFYLISTVLATILLVKWVVDYLREKATSKVLLALKHNILWWAAMWIFVLMIAMSISVPTIKLNSLNKILITLVKIYAVLLPVLNCSIETVLTTKGIEQRLIKGRTKVLIQWSDIIDWSIISDDVISSVIELSYRYKYKGKIKKAKMEAWGDNKERIIKIFQSYVG